MANDWKQDVVSALGSLTVGKDLGEAKAIEIIQHTPTLSDSDLEALGEAYTAAQAEYDRITATLVACLIAGVTPTLDQTNTVQAQTLIGNFFELSSKLLPPAPASKLTFIFDAGIATIIVDAIDKIWTHIEKIQQTKQQERQGLADMIEKNTWESWDFLKNQNRVSTVKLKYPTKIAGKIYPKGYDVPVATLESVKKKLPGVQYSQVSRQIAVQFPDLDNPTLLSIGQIEQYE